MNIKNIPIKPYYYVPPCPNCDSNFTGRFVRNHRNTERDWIINEALRHGELVKPMNDMPVYSNAFCLNCGNIWRANIKFILISADEMRKEKLKRGTAPILEERYEEIRKRDENSNVFGFIGKFIGKI